MWGKKLLADRFRAANALSNFQESVEEIRHQISLNDYVPDMRLIFLDSTQKALRELSDEIEAEVKAVKERVADLEEIK